MLLNVDNTNKIIEIPYIEAKEMLNEEISGKCGTCINDNGTEFIGIIVEDKTDKYVILHELVHALQMLNIPVINKCLTVICDEIIKTDYEYSKSLISWVNEYYHDLYNTDSDFDYDTSINNEIQAHLITDVWENDNGELNRFISMVTDLTDYEIVLLDESEWIEE